MILNLDPILFALISHLDFCPSIGQTLKSRKTANSIRMSYIVGPCHLSDRLDPSRLFEHCSSILRALSSVGSLGR